MKKFFWLLLITSILAVSVNSSLSYNQGQAADFSRSEATATVVTNPYVPQHVQARSYDGQNRVDLSWSAVQFNCSTGRTCNQLGLYFVYRTVGVCSAASSCSWTTVAKLPPGVTAIPDNSAVLGTAYTYAVTSVVSMAVGNVGNVVAESSKGLSNSIISGTNSGSVTNQNTNGVKKVLLHSLSPIAGSVGTSVAATGAGFRSDANWVLFDGNVNGRRLYGFAEKTATSASGTSLNFTLPAEVHYSGCMPWREHDICPAVADRLYPVLPGLYQITIANVDGMSNSLLFTVTGNMNGNANGNLNSNVNVNSNGNTNLNTNANINHNGSNQPPDVTFTTSVTQGVSPLTVTFSASATDPEQDQLYYSYRINKVLWWMDPGESVLVSRKFRGGFWFDYNDDGVHDYLDVECMMEKLVGNRGCLGEFKQYDVNYDRVFDIKDTLSYMAAARYRTAFTYTFLRPGTYTVDVIVRDCRSVQKTCFNRVQKTVTVQVSLRSATPGQ